MKRPSSDEQERIARLRELFLDETRGDRSLRDYWRDDADLSAYDRVLAARIGWKWDAALAECEERGFARAAGETVLDFGCGTGIAARRFARRFGAGEILCHDRSPAAMAFAARTAGGRPLADVSAASPDVLLVSHVLGELDARGRAALRALADRSRRVVLVEAGDRRTARRLSELRDELLPDFHVVAPCPHAGPCPALTGDGDWCHFFAPPPPEVFTDGEWVRTARAVGFDLRALPFAFVALAREPAPVSPPGNRVLGRPRIRSREAVVHVCVPGEVRTVAVGKRDDAATFRALKKHPESVRALPGRPAG